MYAGRCGSEAAAQLQPIPYSCVAQRALLRIAVDSMYINELMNINDVRECAIIFPRSCKLAFDLLTLEVVSESRVTCSTCMPILVFLGLSVLELLPARRRPQGLVVIGVCLSVCVSVCAHCFCPQDISRTGSWITTKFGGWEQGVNL